MATTAISVTEACLAARRASRTLGTLSSAVKDEALRAIARELEARTVEILEANARDLEAASEADYAPAFLDKLRLDESRVAAMAAGARQIANLPDPVGEVIEGWRLPNGLDVRKVRVPLGVVGVVYEARPNVTIDAAGLCLKAGNAVVLRGSSAAARSNALLAQIAASAAAGAGLPEAAVTLLQGGREEITELATQSGLVDLIVPRGGEGLKASLKGVARCRSSMPRRATATSTWMRARSLRPLGRSCSTPSCSAPGCATRRRRCSSTRGLLTCSCPAC
jgi:glutamate-5-semialdehyde dehydrogenase